MRREVKKTRNKWQVGRWEGYGAQLTIQPSVYLTLLLNEPRSSVVYGTHILWRRGLLQFPRYRSQPCTRHDHLNSFVPPWLLVLSWNCEMTSTTVSNINVFCDVVPCSLVDIYPPFGMLPSPSRWMRCFFEISVT
jgi:hypothetical protein